VSSPFDGGPRRGHRGANGAGKSTFFHAHLAATACASSTRTSLAELRQTRTPPLRSPIGSDASSRAKARVRVETVFSDPVGEKLAFLREAAAPGTKCAVASSVCPGRRLRSARGHARLPGWPRRPEREDRGAVPANARQPPEGDSRAAPCAGVRQRRPDQAVSPGRTVRRRAGDTPGNPCRGAGPLMPRRRDSSPHAPRPNARAGAPEALRLLPRTSSTDSQTSRTQAECRRPGASCA